MLILSRKFKKIHLIIQNFAEAKILCMLPPPIDIT